MVPWAGTTVNGRLYIVTAQVAAIAAEDSPAPTTPARLLPAAASRCTSPEALSLRLLVLLATPEQTQASPVFGLSFPGNTACLQSHAN